jgi:uncharacterized tellurite resistance protein B-like protein
MLIMKESIQKLAAVVIYADGEFSEGELNHLEKIAATFGGDKAAMATAIEAEIEKLKPMDEEELQQYMQDAASAITDPESRYKAFDALLELTLSDNELDDLETNVLGNISYYLGIPIHYFANNLAYQVKSRNVEITAQQGWVKPQEN